MSAATDRRETKKQASDLTPGDYLPKYGVTVDGVHRFQSAVDYNRTMVRVEGLKEHGQRWSGVFTTRQSMYVLDHEARPATACTHAVNSDCPHYD